MRKFASVSLLLLCLTLTGCSSVKREEYDSLQSEYNSLQEKYSSLEKEYSDLKTEYDESAKSSEEMREKYAEYLSIDAKKAVNNSIFTISFSVVFGEDIIYAPLDDELSIYQVIVKQTDEITEKAVKAVELIYLFENGDQKIDDSIRKIYLKVVNENGATTADLGLTRDKSGDRFTAIQ